MIDIGLYIKLVTYARLHIQLFIYSCDSCLLSTYLLLFSYPSVVCLLLYLVILCLQLSCYYYVHIVYMHEQSSLHTHSLGRLLTTLDLHVQILDALFLLSGVRWDHTYCEEFWVSLSDSGILISLIFLLFPDSTFITFSCHFFSFIHLLSLR